jgi:hypothetical protein
MNDHESHDDDDDVKPDGQVGKPTEPLQCPNLPEEEAANGEDDFGNDDFVLSAVVIIIAVHKVLDLQQM